MAKKKNNVPKVEEVTEDNFDGLMEEGEESFYSDATAYLPVFNKTRNSYDMWILRVNTFTKEVEIEVEECRYDSVHRATFDLQQRQAKDSTGSKK